MKEEFKKQFESNPELGERKDFLARYNIYKGIDAEKSWQRLMASIAAKTLDGAKSSDGNNTHTNDEATLSHHSNRFIKFISSPHRMMRYAAVAVGIVAVGAMLYFPASNYMAGNSDTLIKPNPDAQVLTAQNQLTIEHAKEMGRVAASIEQLTREEQEMIEESQGMTVNELLEAKKITTVSDHEYWAHLSDGSLVHINGNTRLIYPERFYGNSRDVYIEGEAYFMVAKDSQHPFIVHTPKGDVKVYGTEFFVDTHNATTAATDVVLIRGSVGVTSNATKQETIIKPGEQLSLEANGETNVSNVDLTPYVSWHSGTLSFHDKRLDDVLYILSRWYDLTISYEESALRDILISGTLDRYEAIENILSSLSKSTGAELELKGGYIVVKK